MKKIFIGLVVVISSLLTGCMTDEETAKSLAKDMKAQTAMLNENTFKLSFDKKDISGSCKTNIVVKKEGKVVLNEKAGCLKEFNIKFKDSLLSDRLLSLDVSFSKQNLVGKTYGWFNIITITKDVKVYKNEDNQIEVPYITQNINPESVEIKYGKTILIEQDGISLETTISY